MSYDVIDVRDEGFDGGESAALLSVQSVSLAPPSEAALLALDDSDLTRALHARRYPRPPLDLPALVAAPALPLAPLPRTRARLARRHLPRLGPTVGVRAAARAVGRSPRRASWASGQGQGGSTNRGKGTACVARPLPLQLYTHEKLTSRLHCTQSRPTSARTPIRPLPARPPRPLRPRRPPQHSSTSTRLSRQARSPTTSASGSSLCAPRCVVDSLFV